MRNRLIFQGVSTLAFFLLPGFWNVPSLLAAEAASDNPGTLYERLGRSEGIRLVVEDFVAHGLADPAVNFTRQGTSRSWVPTPVHIDRLIRHLVQFISAAAGGPGTYEGREMKAVHAGMRIAPAEFDALLRDLEASLVKFSVQAREQKELLALIETTRAEIVEPKQQAS